MKPIASFAQNALAARCGEAAVAIVGTDREVCAPAAGELAFDDGVATVTMADGARVLICALDDAAALEPAAAAGAVAAGDVIARVTGAAEGTEVALGVALADPEQFLDAFPVSNHPTVKRGDIVLSAIELAR